MKRQGIRGRVFSLMTIGAILIFDIVTKAWAMKALANTPAQTANVVSGVLSFRYAENHGVAFSLLRDYPSLVMALTIFILLIVAAVLFLPDKTGVIARLSLSMVLSGGVGNLIDRIRFGYVIDFIRLDFISFPIFNVADIAVVLGTALFAIDLFFPNKRGVR